MLDCNSNLIWANVAKFVNLRKVRIKTWCVHWQYLSSRLFFKGEKKLSLFWNRFPSRMFVVLYIFCKLESWWHWELVMCVWGQNWGPVPEGCSSCAPGFVRCPGSSLGHLGVVQHSSSCGYERWEWHPRAGGRIQGPEVSLVCLPGGSKEEARGDEGKGGRNILKKRNKRRVPERYYFRVQHLYS